MTLAWRIINTSPAHQLGTIIARRRALYNTRYYTAISPLLSSSSSSNEQNDNNELLETKLRQLAKLNNGISVNPRSPRQVSNLLYNGYDIIDSSSSTYNNGKSNSVTLGPTDKATLQQIILQDNDINSDGASHEVDGERQKEIAKLVLQCRELLATTASGNSGRKGSNAQQQSESFMSKATRGQQLLVEEEQVPVDNDDIDKEATTALPKVPAYHQSTQLSPYEQMVLNLFPNIDNNVDNNNVMTIDQYWLEPLLQLTKSNSRSLVQQLQATSCPMGYNQAANPLSSITLANSTTTTPVKRTTSLLSYIRSQKYNHYKDSIILVRVGDFYETYGIDAIMLVEYCGLNPMAGKARAGCPWRNIQGTLDGLTSVGYRVAVYEEWNGSDSSMPGGIDEEQKKSGLKPRYLSQVVSSANPTYMHNLVLNDDSSAADDDNTPSSIHSNGDLSSSSPGRYYVGVIETNSGYTLVEVSAEERTVVVSERLTAEAVSCRLVAYPPADPLFYVPPYTEDVVSGSGRNKKLDRLPFLPWRQQQQQSSSPLASQRLSNGNGMMMGKVRVKTLPPSLVVSPRPGMTDVERSKQTIVSAFLRLEDDSSLLTASEERENDSSSTKATRRVVTHDDFLVAASTTSSSSVDESDSKNGVTETHPLHLETATQLGLMSDPAIPPLISSLLPDSAPPSSRRFLRRWLLIPPPPHIADAMSLLTHTLKEENDKALPSLNAPPLTGKVISLIRAGQSSAAIYREILSALDAASEVLKLDDNIVKPLLEILHHDTGTEVSDADSLRTRFLDAMKIIERVVSTQNMETLQNSNYNGVDDPQSLDYISYYGDVVPKAFFERNEAIWRGRVKPNTLEDAHKVDMAAKRLSEAIAIDFWGCDVIEYDDEGLIELYDAKETKNIVVTQEIFNNILAIKTIPDWVKGNGGEDNAKYQYFHPRDRNGKVLTTRYTTESVQDAMSEYVEACSSAREEVERVLTQLSWDIVDNDHLSAILQASHLNLILSTAAHHAASSNVKGWNVATIYDNNDDDRDSAGNFTGLWPYWMDKSESVSNSFDLNGLFLLTAPNMSGKSTLMRSTAAAALVANAGLCAPVSSGSSIKRFDSLFVRGASSDVPTEDKSAFGAEMGDVSALLRSCGEHSLVFVDEIGRGTSPKDGTSLAGAILEKMAETNMSGMFATHLHGILKLPYSSKAEERMIKKRMAITEDSSGQLNWTYKLEDGICTNSLALHTASKFGLPESIIKRAEELSHHWDADKDDHTESSVTDYPAASGNTTSNSINHAATILEDIVGENSTRIPPSYITPPSYEGISCVYVLQVGDDEKSRYYVGETDSLSQRLSQHRSKGKDWSSLSAIAVKVKDGKSTARNVESLVIQQMAKDGFNLVSITDGISIKPKQAT